jgi:hypothetical protein
MPSFQPGAKGGITGLTPFYISASIEVCLALQQRKTPNR